jgi:hypothetical protein
MKILEYNKNETFETSLKTGYLNKDYRLKKNKEEKTLNETEIKTSSILENNIFDSNQ